MLKAVHALNGVHNAESILIVLMGLLIVVAFTYAALTPSLKSLGERNFEPQRKGSGDAAK